METRMSLTCVTKKILHMQLSDCGRGFIFIYILFICLAAYLTSLFSLAQHSFPATALT